MYVSKKSMSEPLRAKLSELIIEGMEQLTTQGHPRAGSGDDSRTRGHSGIRTRDVYDVYTSLSDYIDADRLAQRRMRDHLIELDMLVSFVRGNLPPDPSEVRPTFELRVEPSTAIEEVLEAVSSIRLG